MNNITEELLKDFQNYQKEIENISLKLYEKAKEVLEWEEKNLGIQNEYKGYKLKLSKTDCIEFFPSYYGSNIDFDEDYELDEEHYAVFLVYDSWAYGGYDEKEISIPLYKLLTDDWKEKELRKYNAKLELQQKEKEKEEQERIREIEKKERADYERLKKKFEGKSSFKIKNWEQMKIKYPEDRDNMDEDRLREFVNDCFYCYENEKFAKKFWSPYSGYNEREGQKFEVVGRCTEEDSDISTLPMWKIKFEDGEIISAYPEEIIVREMKDNGCKLEDI